MVPPLFFYELGLIALVWLFLLLCWLGPNAAVRCQPITSSKPPQRKRSTAPTAFAGLTTKPPCVLCERDAAPPQPAPPAPPAPMPLPTRRSRTVDTSQHFCPHAGCRYRGWRGRGNLRANGHPNGGPWRQFQCTACEGYFPEHHGTMFHGKQVAVELIVRVLACLAEGLGIRATARVFEIAPNTVLHWLVEAAEQLRAFSDYFLCAVRVRQVQLDELYAVLREVKSGALSEDEAIKRLERSPAWVWTALDPDSKLLLVIDVGTRVSGTAKRGTIRHPFPHRGQTGTAQFLAVCRRSKWSKHATNSPLLALLAMAGSHTACKIGSVANFDFGGKIQKPDFRNSIAYRPQNSRKSKFATEPMR